MFNNNKITFLSILLHLVPQLRPNIQSSFTKVFVYVTTSIFQPVYISHYAFFILIRMQFATMVQGMSLLWLLFLLGIQWACSIFTLFILSLDFNVLLTFSLHIDPRFHCQLLLLQRPQFWNYFFENCPLDSFSSISYKWSSMFFAWFRNIPYVTYISVYRFKFFQDNFNLLLAAK